MMCAHNRRTALTCVSMLLALMFLYSQGSESTEKSGLLLFRVVDAKASFFIPFEFQDYETRQVVKGLRSSEPLLTLQDIESVKLTSMERSGRPITVLDITYSISSLNRVLKRETDHKSSFVVFFDGAICAKIELETIQTLVEQKVPLFLALPIRTSAEYERISNHIKKWQIKKK